MMKFILGGLLLVAWPLLASDTNSLTLQQVITASRADNAQIRALNQKAGAMRERSRQAGSLANPMVTYRGMDSASGGQWPNTDEKRLEIEQAFPWPGKRALMQGMATQDAEAMQSETAATILDVELAASEAFYSLYAVQQSLVIVRSEADLLRRIEELTTLRYTTGAAGQQDVLKARTETILLKQKVVELEGRELTLQHKLNTLMNRPVNAVIGPLRNPASTERRPPASRHDEEQIAAKAFSHRPELQAAQARIERARAERGFMQKEGLPDYKVGLEYRSMPAGDQAMFMVGIELPIWRAKIGAGVRGADRMVQSELAAHEVAERQVVQEVQDALAQIQTAQRTLALASAELIPQAELRFAASEAAYRSGGKGDFMDLLESERFLLNARVMAVMAEAELGLQWARLARAVGVSVLDISEEWRSGK